jgi:hypothetical protein
MWGVEQQNYLKNLRELKICIYKQNFGPFENVFTNSSSLFKKQQHILSRLISHYNIITTFLSSQFYFPEEL